MRVNVQLIDAELGNHLWAERFDKPVTDLFDMQDEIVARLANTLNAQIVPAEAWRAEQAPNPDSMDLYLQGLAWLNKGVTPGNVVQARSFYDRALLADPDNFDALIGSRELRGVPKECPSCGSPRLEPEQGKNTATPGVLWERPRCADCGWTGRPVPIVGVENGRPIITREGEESHEHSIMTVPLRTILKPGDRPIEPLKNTEGGPPEPVVYFAYGSNMSTARLRERMPSCKPLGTATLPGHALRFHKRSTDKSGKCNAFP
jgi:hypothetical protein